jgi:hypothetical protein
VYILCSWASGLCGIIGVVAHIDWLMWVTMPLLLVSLFLGWLIDQADWWMPVVVSSLYWMPRPERIRTRIYCGLAFLSRCVAQGACAAWINHLLTVAATGGPY